MLTGLGRTMLALAAGAALAFAGCGDDEGSGDARPAASGNAVDRAFVADMIPHHEAALQMAKTAQRRGSSPFVERLAEDILRTQAAEIEAMRAADERLKSAGVTQGSLGVPADRMGMDHDGATLETAKPFDPAFLRMMLPHHEGAIVMSRAQLAKGRDRELRRLARQIITAQQREISAMRKQLAQHGAAPMDDMDAAHGSGHSG
jgi:uncharacterized protein (DUF305 family)